MPNPKPDSEFGGQVGETRFQGSGNIQDTVGPRFGCGGGCGWDTDLFVGKSRQKHCANPSADERPTTKTQILSWAERA